MSDIPLVDLKAQHRQIEESVLPRLQEVMQNTAFVLGKDVAEFEKQFAHFVGARHCIGVANGTDALELAVRALGIGPKDEVIVPTNSFIASALAVARAGATPVLVDSDPRYHLLDVDQTLAKVTSRTRAVTPVHLFGQCAPLEALRQALPERVWLIEDAAQAQGARRAGVGAGALGLIAGTSFYPSKNLGAYGDAGAVLTSSDELAKKVKALRNYGSEVKYHHPETGFNSRLDTLQAVVLLEKLKLLAHWNEQRRQAAARYDAMLAGLSQITLPETLEGNEHIFHLYVIRVPNRDEVLKRLQADGIGAGIHYPVPIHLQGAFAGLGHKRGDFPVAEKAAGEILSLPMYAELSEQQQARVVEALRKAVGA